MNGWVESGAAVRIDVLVVGAGPTGLTAAIECLRQGLSVRVVDRREQRAEGSKALVVHARTMEAFRAMEVAEEIRSIGLPFAALNVFPDARPPAIRVPLDREADWGDTEFPYWLSAPQVEVERCLERRLGSLGGEVEWAQGLLDMHQDDSGVHAQLAGGECDARWLVGCDGGRSTLREQLGIRMERRDDGQLFVLADVLTRDEFPDDEGRVYRSRKGLTLIVPMPEPRRFRLIAHLPRLVDPPLIDASFVDQLVLDRTGVALGAHSVGWTSHVFLSHGQSQKMRRGRAFLAGDAAHLHSPVGGQGLNAGVQDAHDLIWKIAAAERGAPGWLESYEAERSVLAGRLVRAVTLATRVMTLQRLVPWALTARVARIALSTGPLQRQLTRRMGMLEQKLPPGPGVDKTPWAGRRLPNPFVGEQRMHDRIDPLRPSIVELPEGGVVVVRPDRVVVGRYPSATAIPPRIQSLLVEP
ncbi:MAG: FAD-dependent monooxygenase [Myxococcota bacterium]|nr:FAD-dependent monooxygenase [Myxococcota bacterium]